jgi:hypothetical protein
VRLLAFALIAAAAPALAEPDPDPDPVPCDTVDADADGDGVHTCTRSDPVYSRNVPLPGLSFDAMLGIAPGAVGDRYGLGFAGATSLENRYVIDGANTTGLAYGDLALALPLDFLGSITVFGAPDATQAASTGGLVHVATRRGTNVVHGSAVVRIKPGALTAGAAQPEPAGTVAGETRRAYDADALVEVGGPIARRRAWFYLGAGARLVRVDVDRIVATQVDVDQDGRPDRDADGMPRRIEIERRRAENPTRQVPFIAKVNVAPAAAHQGSFAIFGVATRAEATGLFGEDAAVHQIERRTNVAAVAAWSSAFGGGETELEATLAWYGLRATRGGRAGGDAVPQWSVTLDPRTAAARGLESARVAEACEDGSTRDPFPLIANCPGAHTYAIGGPGQLGGEAQDRWTARVAAARRVRAAGHHRVSAGLELGTDRLVTRARPSGGESGVLALTAVGGAILSIDRHVELGDGPGFEPCGTDETGQPVRCRVVAEARTATQTRTIAGFVHDAWSPVPELTIDAGLRLGVQTLVDRGLSLGPEWAPRGRVAYDWTGQGRGHVYVEAGRYHQALVLAGPHRALGVSHPRQLASCGVDPAARPEATTCPLDASVVVGAGAADVPDRLRAAYDDQVAVSVDRAVTDRLWVSAGYQHRRAGRVIEDVDRGAFLALANPPEAQRDYRALHVVARADATRRFALWVTYTRSWLRGNYSGLFHPSTGQLDPNVLSVFDAPDLIPPRDAPLPLDHAHRFAMDGFYTWRLGDHALTLGSRVRFQLGAPRGVLGAHPEYGPGEVDILPRGALGRAAALSAIDLHLGIRRRLARDVELELFADAFDVMDRQDPFTTDERFTDDSVRPIAGGDPSDLLFLKAADPVGRETSAPAGRNPRYGEATSRYAPRSIRLGARLTF